VIGERRNPLPGLSVKIKRSPFMEFCIEIEDYRSANTNVGLPVDLELPKIE
jgi:hypothetical protein